VRSSRYLIITKAFAIRIRIPVVKGDNMSVIRQNYMNDQMFKTHKHKIIGYITCTVRLDPGLVG
jgi:hypothetical protein